MANPIKGEVPFAIPDGPHKGAYVLLLDFNALCSLEDVVPGLMDGSANLGKPSAIRAVFHAALSDRHSDVTLADAGRIIHTIGLEKAAELIGQASDASFGKSEEKDGARPPASPAKDGAGTGP